MKRDAKLDIAKGVLIVLVVVGHFLEASNGPSVDRIGSGWSGEPQKALLTAIYLFHMPAFAALVGVTASSKRLGQRLVQNATLLVVMQAGYAAIFYAKDRAVPFDWYTPYFVLWFLAAMIFWLLTVPLIDRLGAWALLPALAVSAAVGFVGFDPSILGIGRAAHFLPFFVLGHLAAGRLISRSRSWPRTAPVAGGAVLIAATVIFMALGPSFRWLYGRESYDSLNIDGAQGVPVQVLLVPTCLVVAIAALALVPNQQGWLRVTGRHTLPIFLLHPVALLVAGPVMEKAAPHLPAVAMTLVAIVGAAAVVVILRLPIFETILRRVGSLLVTRRKAGAHAG